MIHFLPESDARPVDAVEAPGPYAEAIARLASIRQALACVEQVAGMEPSESMAEAKLAAAWPVATPARRRCFDTRSARTAAAAAAGLEALAAHTANPAAVERLRTELDRGVDSIDQLFSL